MDPVGVHVPTWGSKSSALDEPPAVTNTVPLYRRVAVCITRGLLMAAVVAHVPGLAALAG
jgi:hypothetical protein